MLSWPVPKDPNDEADYQFDWSERLEPGETISTSVFTADSNEITLDNESFGGALTTVWISGGVAGSVYEITNRVVTNEGRTYDQTSRLRIRSQ